MSTTVPKLVATVTGLVCTGVKKKLLRVREYHSANPVATKGTYLGKIPL